MDDWVSKYQSRLVFLIQAAEKLRHDCEEMIGDAGIAASIKSEVLSAEQFAEIARRSSFPRPLVDIDCQIVLIIEILDINAVEGVKRLIESNYSVISADWKTGSNNEPQMHIKCHIPPQVRPHGYQDRNDVPNMCILAVRGTKSELEDANFVVPRDGNFQALALSGGGLRATIFHLGVLARLHLSNQLAGIETIVSVSGGSITAAYFALNWERATEDQGGFINVASELIKFTQNDVRNSVFIPWVWTRFLILSSSILVLWFWNWAWAWPTVLAAIILFFFFRGRSARLQNEYERLFKQKTLGDLSKCPSVALIATETIGHYRAAFTANNVLRYKFEGEPLEPIYSGGVKLSFAVAASSCFPPAFSKYFARHKKLGLTFKEFQGLMWLNDGGVSGNLGIEVLRNICKNSGTEINTVLISDAERGQTFMPLPWWPLTNVNAMGAALSANAVALAEKEFKKPTFVRFRERMREEPRLPNLVQTALFNYRTDLDKPTWPEIAALMMQGELQCRRSISEEIDCLNDGDSAKQLIEEIITAAGCEKFPSIEPSDLECSSFKAYWWPIFNLLACLFVSFALSWGVLTITKISMRYLEKIQVQANIESLHKQNKDVLDKMKKILGTGAALSEREITLYDSLEPGMAELLKLQESLSQTGNDVTKTLSELKTRIENIEQAHAELGKYNHDKELNWIF